MACPLPALVIMKLLGAALGLSAIPSSGALASQQGTTRRGSFLQQSPKLGLDKFNEQAEAVNKKIDKMELQCKMMQIKDKEILSGLNRDMRVVSGQLAGNIALESDAATKAKQERAQSTKLKEQLGKTQEMCGAQQKHLDASVESLKKDQGKAKMLRSLSGECFMQASLAAVNSSVSSTKVASFLQGCGEQVTAPMRAAVQALEKQAQFNTEFAKQAWSDALKEASAGSTFSALLESDKAWPASSKPASLGKAKAANACSLGKGMPNCHILKSRLYTIAGAMEEEKDAAVTNQRKQTEACRAKETELNERIKSTDAQYARTSAELVRVTGIKAGLAASRASIQQRLDRTDRDMKKQDSTCTEGTSQYKAELEEILAKRLKAAQAAAGGRVIIQDCQVTDWVASKCSKPCRQNAADEVGVMNFTRSTNQPAGPEGFSCPPFAAKLPCNDKPCPVDCAVDEWTKWGACSKACGGGTAKRNRKVTTQAKDGGKVCPGLEMRKSCNVGSCSEPCTLKEWTSWSACSRRCKFSKNSAAGRQRRFREIKGNPVQEGGGSSCPAADDKTRLQIQKCNDEVCPRGITCDAKEDVVFLVDNSGDPDAGEAYANQVKLLEAVVGASSENVHFGVVSYGKEVKILSRITADKGRTNWLISRMTTDYSPPKGGMREVTRSMTVARTLFADPGVGRGRPKIAVLLLGGSPASYLNAKKASEEMRAAGVRVVVGFVDNGGARARKQACGLASSPCSANVEAVKSFGQMATVSRAFLSTLCLDLVYPKAPSQMR